MSFGVGRRRSSDSTLLWLWHRPVAAAPIHPLAWELPYAAGVAPKKRQKKKSVLWKTDKGKAYANPGSASSLGPHLGCEYTHDNLLRKASYS